LSKGSAIVQFLISDFKNRDTEIVKNNHAFSNITHLGDVLGII